MSTRHDKNFHSFDSLEQKGASDLILDPIAAGWERGSWEDTCKFYKRHNLIFMKITVVGGGKEDCFDVSPECTNNVFGDFSANTDGQYVLTLKGGSHKNTFLRWHIKRGGKTVDIEIGNWSSSNFETSKNNLFHSWTKDNDKPITYCYRLGCKPEFKNMNVKHLWWRSIGITVYWWGKYFIHRILKVSDK